MNASKKYVIAAATIAVIGAGIGTAAANASSSDTSETDTSISGDALDRASSAALDHTGNGRVTETEVGDEDSYYEVEVTLDDGSQVDVQLDKDFKVVDVMADLEDSSDNDD